MEDLSRTTPSAEELVSRWRGRPRSLRLVRRGTNVVYAFEKDGARFFMRLTPSRHRSCAQLEAELDFVHFVASRGVAVACPARSAAGALIESVRAVDGDWHAVVFAAAKGRHFRFFSDDVDSALFRVWGSAMAALHAASRAFVPVSSRRRPSWAQQNTTRCDTLLLPGVETAARSEHGRIAVWLESLPVTVESWGLIHGDLERTNFTLHRGVLRMFDFDDACYHWYLADAAHALWAFRRAPPAARRRFLAWFLEGYRERGEFGIDVREHFSWFVRLRSLSLFVNRLLMSPNAGGDDWIGRQRAAFAEPFRW